MISILAYTIAVLLMYLGFYVTDWLGQEHWAYYPTVFVFGTLVLIHLALAIIKLNLRKKDDDKN